MMRCTQNGKERVAEGRVEGRRREREREGVKEMDVAQEGGKDSGERGMETATLHPSEATSNCTSNRPS